MEDKSKPTSVVIGIAMLIFISIIIVCAMPFVNAAITKTYDSSTKTITILNGGSQIASLTLLDNTDWCGDIFECRAIIKVDLDITVSPFSALKLNDKRNGGTSSVIAKTYYSLDGITYSLFTPGQSFSPGTYYLKINATKPSSDIIDWVITSGGFDITEWALWGDTTLPNGLKSVHTFDSGLADSINSSFNMTYSGGFISISNINKSGNAINSSNSITSGSKINWTTSPLSLLNTYSNMTLAFWFNQNGTCNDAYNNSVIFGAGASGDATKNFAILYNCNQTSVTGWNDMVLLAGPTTWTLSPHTTNKYYKNSWHFVVFSTNKTYYQFIVDNITEASGTWASATFDFSSQAFLFDGSNNDANTRPASNLRIDEFYVWNRTLTPSELGTLWGGGSGLFYNPNSSSISLQYPADGAIIPYKTINFTSIENFTSLKNATISIKNSTGSVIKSETKLISNNYNVTNFSVTDLQLGNYTWNVLACNSTNYCAQHGTDNLLYRVSFIDNSETYNSSAYESDTESFILNLTYDSSDFQSIIGQLYYDGTLYSGISSSGVNNILFTKSIQLSSSSIGNNSFLWELSLTNSTGTLYVNTTTNYQNVSAANLTICGSAPQNVPYFNVTFLDETTSLVMNGSTDLATWEYYISSIEDQKTYLYTGSNNLSYAYCFSPPFKPIIATVRYQYSYTGYPQRTYTYSGTLTNSTTNLVLYLLSSANGAYSTFSIQTTAGTPISGATVQVERQFSGVWTVVGYGTSDSSGSATFWVNPNYQHRITVTKSGYSTNQVTIQPTQSVYTIFLSNNLGNSSYAMPIKGIYYSHQPMSGLLPPGTYTYTFNITAMNSNMINCRFDLINGTNRSQVLSSTTSSCTSNGYLTQSYTSVAGQSIFGNYYVDVGSGWILLEGDGNWKFISTNASSIGTIKRLINYLSDDTIWTNGDQQEYMKYEYTKIVALFLILAVLLAAANIGFSLELINPGIVLFGIPLIFTMLSIAGGVNGHGYLYIQNLTIWPFLDNYIVAAYSWGIAIGMYFAAVRREG